MICAQCDRPTDHIPCEACGAEPLLDRKYRLQQVITRARRSAVYRALDKSGGSVAVKKLIVDRAGEGIERALREADFLSQLSHPSIPSWIDVCKVINRHGAAVFIVQEFIEGETLAEELASHRYNQQEVLTILEEMLSILEYLHGLSPPVIHRDIKAQNTIRRREDRRLMLVDFGSARDVVEASVGRGTYGYMAPEMYAGKAGPAADLYSLGALAVYLLTRKEPSHFETQLGHRLSWKPGPALHPSLVAFVDALLEPDLRKRIGTVDQARQGLREARRGIRAGVPAPRVAPSLRGSLGSGLRRFASLGVVLMRRAMVVALLMGMLVTIGAGLWVGWEELNASEWRLVPQIQAPLNQARELKDYHHDFYFRQAEQIGQIDRALTYNVIADDLILSGDFARARSYYLRSHEADPNVYAQYGLLTLEIREGLSCWQTKAGFLFFSWPKYSCRWKDEELRLAALDKANDLVSRARGGELEASVIRMRALAERKVPIQDGDSGGFKRHYRHFQTGVDYGEWRGVGTPPVRVDP